MRIAVIVTTYNWADALAAVLRGLARQTHRDYEVLVADDGSRPDTGERIAGIAADYPVPLRHLWQADDGFRAAAARNRAVAATDADYLVFLDGDCLVRADFLARHAQLAAPGHLVAGNRVLFSAASSERVLQQGLAAEAWSPAQWLGQRLSGGVNRLSSLLRLPPGAWRDRRPERWEGVKTCNLGLWRDAFLAVNGFDERYQGWGYEDSDLTIRLIRNGIKRRDGRFATTVLHLWHREHERAGTDQNLARLHALERGEGAIRAGLGVDQYQSSRKSSHAGES